MPGKGARDFCAQRQDHIQDGRRDEALEHHAHPAALGGGRHVWGRRACWRFGCWRQRKPLAATSVCACCRQPQPSWPGRSPTQPRTRQGPHPSLRLFVQNPGACRRSAIETKPAANSAGDTAPAPSRANRSSSTCAAHGAHGPYWGCRGGGGTGRSRGDAAVATAAGACPRRNERAASRAVMPEAWAAASTSTHKPMHPYQNSALNCTRDLGGGPTFLLSWLSPPDAPASEMLVRTQPGAQ